MANWSGILKALDRAVEDWFRSSSGGQPKNDAASACEHSRRVAPYTFRTEDKGTHDWTPNGAEEKTNHAADAEIILQILERYLPCPALSAGRLPPITMQKFLSVFVFDAGRSGATQATLYEVKKAWSKTPLPASSCNVAHLPAHRGSYTLPTAAEEAVQSAAHAIDLSANDRSSSDGAKSGIGCALRRLGSGELALSNIELASPCHNAGCFSLTLLCLAFFYYSSVADHQIVYSKSSESGSIEEGSVLLAVDGNAVSGLRGAQVAHLTQGPPGSDLLLTVRRPGGSVDRVRVRRLHHVQHYDRSRRVHPDSEPSVVSRLREPSRPTSHRHRGVTRAAELAVGGGPRRSNGGDEVLPPATRGLVSSMRRDPPSIRQNVSFSASVAREEPAEMDSSQQARRASSPSEVHLGPEESMVSRAWWTRGWNWVADDTPDIVEHWLSKKESGAAALQSQVNGLRSWLSET